MKVKVMLSNHHIHLTQEAADALFGENGLTIQRYTSGGDSGPYACNECVTLAGPKGKIENIRVLGPCRSYNQAELLKADSYKLGIDLPMRISGDLEGAAVIKVVGPKGELELPCGIIALRHIHMKKDMAEENAFVNKERVSVQTFGERAVRFDNVEVHVGGPEYVMHIDTEEGNAAGLKNGDVVEIIR